MKQCVRGLRIALVLWLIGLGAHGCAPGTSSPEPTPSGSGGGVSSGGSSTGGTGTSGATGGTGSGGARSSGGSGVAATGGTPGTGGMASSSGGSGSGGASTAGGTGGQPNGGRGGATGGNFGGAGSTGVAGAGGKTGGSGGAGNNNCNLPVTVGFQADVQPFLITTCGNGSGSGCHVIDTGATTGTGTGSKNHAYDWITAGAHASSCPEKPTPKRFEIVVDVIRVANAATCSKSRKMPPPDATGSGKRTPLTDCQIAVLQSWLSQPMVTQVHRADDSSPTTAYAMPPFN